MADNGENSGISLRTFTDVDVSPALAAYIAGLESFDAIPQLQDLKGIARQQVTPGASVLDVGCGFGLETERLFAAAAPDGLICGIDKSAAFITEARRRAAEKGMDIAYEVGDATALPYARRQFDVVRAERLLIYLDDPLLAISEMKRVMHRGALLALIEPDLTLMSVNVPNRDLVRRILAHECDTAVHNSWLPGRLRDMLTGAGFKDVSLATRVVVFPQDLAVHYFIPMAEQAERARKITADELAEWREALTALHAREGLFCTIGYFLFMARA
ncbi:methyltransferase domain-containing protein [Rhodoligotrophos ferricapiens]|uniref:methyltransferase domain-containing protein n=1 Tax=Rhodoligotrophos ferricapiens TaxID=3069264 RepID=UPI00315CEC1E